MKKYFVILAAVAMIANVACTKVNPEEKKTEKISFTVANYVPATKAGEVSFLNEFSDPANAQFKCKAFMKGVGVAGMQDFFGTTGETITWKPSVPEWSPSHDYYWPKDAASYVNFFSWYDTSTTNGPTVTNGTMKWTNRTIATGDNIMYADPAWHFQQNITTYKLDGQATPVGVPTLFHHALSQIEVKAYAAKTSVENLLSWTIKLTDVKIGKIFNQGTLELTSTEPAATAFNQKGTWNGTPAWTTTGTASGELTPAALTVTATTKETAQTLLGNQSVLPQALDGVNITLKLDITTTYTAGQSNHEIIDVTIPLTDFTPTAWELNKKYTYYIKISPAEKRVLFDPAVESAWVTVDAGEKAL